MSRQKKTPTNTPMLAGAGLGAETEQATTSVSNDTTTPAPRQVVADWLEHGEQSGKTMRQLQEFLNGSSREIRLEIQRERLNGTPILSGQSGYYLPANVGEVERFCSSMGSRLREIQKTVRAVAQGAGLSKCAPQIDGQTDFWDGDSG